MKRKVKSTTVNKLHLNYDFSMSLIGPMEAYLLKEDLHALGFTIAELNEMGKLPASSQHKDETVYQMGCHLIGDTSKFIEHLGKSSSHKRQSASHKRLAVIFATCSVAWFNIMLNKIDPDLTILKDPHFKMTMHAFLLAHNNLCRIPSQWRLAINSLVEELLLTSRKEQKDEVQS